jgi:hypothetical protein
MSFSDSITGRLNCMIECHAVGPFTIGECLTIVTLFIQYPLSLDYHLWQRLGLNFSVPKSQAFLKFGETIFYGAPVHRRSPESLQPKFSQFYEPVLFSLDHEY